MHLYLVRHGAVTPPRPGVFYGGTEVPLSAVGREQAMGAARMLAGAGLDLVVCSPLERARFGAACIVALHPGAALEVEPRLREIDRGRWVGWTEEQVRRRFPGDLEAHGRDPAAWRGHGGESLGDLRARVLAARDALLARMRDSRVAVVSHLWPTRAILAEALGLGLADWHSIAVPTGSVSLVRTNGTQVQVAWTGRTETDTG